VSESPAEHGSEGDAHGAQPAGEPAGNGDLGGDLAMLLNTVLRSSNTAAELLLSLQTHVHALTLVSEAHERGAITLPESVVRSVRLARSQIPAFLTGARGAVPIVSS
jgi:hypothetical protein